MQRQRIAMIQTTRESIAPSNRHGEYIRHIEAPENFTLKGGELKVINTGLIMSIPMQHAIMLTGYRSLTAKGVLVFPDQLDCTNMGPVCVQMKNMTSNPVSITRLDKIACIALIKVIAAEYFVQRRVLEHV